MVQRDLAAGIHGIAPDLDMSSLIGLDFLTSRSRSYPKAFTAAQA